jgi:hypothetical protein
MFSPVRSVSGADRKRLRLEDVQLPSPSSFLRASVPISSPCPPSPSSAATLGFMAVPPQSADECASILADIMKRAHASEPAPAESAPSARLPNLAFGPLLPPRRCAKDEIHATVLAAKNSADMRASRMDECANKLYSMCRNPLSVAFVFQFARAIVSQFIFEDHIAVIPHRTYYIQRASAHDAALRLIRSALFRRSDDSAAADRELIVARILLENNYTAIQMIIGCLFVSVRHASDAVRIVPVEHVSHASSLATVVMDHSA